MNWFGLSKPEKKSAGNAAPARLRTVQSTFESNPQTNEPTTTGSGLQTLTEKQKIITTLAEAPTRVSVLTGVDALSPDLVVPESLQDALMVIKTSPQNAVLLYDPAFTTQVKGYFKTLRTAVTSTGLKMPNDALLATSAVLRDIRLAEADKKGMRGVQGTGSKSSGSVLFKEWAVLANEMGATDIHIAVIDGGRGQVLVRVDGELEPINAQNKGIFTDRDVKAVHQAAFDMADAHSNSDGTFSERAAMSCMIDQKLGINNVRLRYSTQRGFFGPKAVCRILHSDLTLPPKSFTSMGLMSSQISLLEQAQRLESGAIIKIGVTGSGKTTLAKTMIETHPKNGVAAFYGIADPIEYLLKNTHQIYIQRDLMTLSEAGKKDPYSEAIESLMRMDPDLIDVGEVRDALSARALSNVANSGHVALGTLHAPGIGGAITRLTDPKMGLTRQELTSGKMLGFLSYLALVPLLCSCSTDFNTAVAWSKSRGDDREANYLGRLTGQLLTKYGIDKSQFKFKNGEGCPSCKGRGTRGLTMVAEMMLPDDEWLDIAAKGNDRAAMRAWRNCSDKRIDSPNMNGKLVAEHAIYNSITGKIDPRTIERFGPLEQLEVLV